MQARARAEQKAHMEKRKRNIVFGNFIEDTKENAFTTVIWETLDEVKTEIEEVFT